MKYSIVLIVSYFGKFCNYFDLWLTSVRYNPTINWLLFTDDTTCYDYPTNVRVEYMNLDELKEIVQHKFDFPITLDISYKLCDYKPAYGFIFQSYIKQYDFWGHCDIDIIFGNIRKFITDEVLSLHERILSRGHFSLYRNSDTCNQFFMKKHHSVPYFKDVFKKRTAFAFDEWGGTSKLWKYYANDKFYDKIVFDDIYMLKRHFVSCQKRSDAEERKKKCQVYLFDQGALFKVYLDKVIKKDETLYIHLQKRIMSIQLKNHKSNSFLIVPNQFIDSNESISKLFLFFHGRPRIFYNTFFKIKIKNAIKKLKLLFSK